MGQTSGMDDALRKKISENRLKFLDKVVEIKGMERLKSGAIRHPQWGGLRPDKKAKDCVYRSDEQ
jgi:ATP-dependent DNA ligase